MPFSLLPSGIASRTTVCSRLRSASVLLAVGCALHGNLQAQSLLELVQATTGYDAPWQAALAEYEASQRRSDQARAALLPSVGVGAELSRSHTRLHPLDARHSASTHSTALTASQALYRPGERIQWSQSKLAAEQSQTRLDTAAQDLILRVAQAYFDVLAAQDALAVVQAQKAAITEQLAFAQRNFEVGNATITDTREAQAQFDLATAQEISALNTLQVRQLTLEQVTGVTAARPAPLVADASLPRMDEHDVIAWVSRAQEQQPQIRQALLAVDIARLETQRAETGHLPTVDLSARLSHSENPNGTITAPTPGTRTQQGSVGVQLNLPLFAGFAVQNRVRETLALEKQASAQLQQARRQTVQNTQTAFFNLQSGLSQITALQAAEASSLSALEANQLGYQVGVRINIDVLNAQSQLYQTRRDLAQARYQVLLGHLQLEHAAGTLDMDSVRRINALLQPAAAHP